MLQRLLDSALRLRSADLEPVDASSEVAEAPICASEAPIGRMEGDASPDSPTVNEVDRLLGHTELARIFDLLPPEDLLGRAALVCKRW